MTCWAGSGSRRAAGSSPPSRSTPRVGLDGAPLPARLPATAAVFAAGRASLRHVEVDRPGARLGRPPGGCPPQQWAGAEEQLAAKADAVHPVGAAGLGHGAGRGAGPGRRGARRPAAGRGQRAAPDPAAAGGGKIKGRFDDAAMFDAIAAVIDAQGPAAHRRRRPLAPRSGRPRRWPTCAATSSTTRRRARSAAGAART